MAAVSDLVYKPLENQEFSNFIRSFGECDLHNGPWVAGGSVRKVWHGLPWRGQDVDWFFQDASAFSSFKSNMDTKYLSRSPIDRAFMEDDLVSITIKSDRIVDCFSTDNAETYSNNSDDGWKVQAIRKYFPKDLSELFLSFDFTVCQFATDGRMMVATKEAIRDCNDKVINMVENSTKRLAVWRTMKYAAYGFSPTDECMREILKAFSDNQPVLDGMDEY